MSELTKRAITGFFFTITLIFSVYYSKESIIGLFFIISMLSLKEFYNISTKNNIKPNKTLGFILGFIVFAYSISSLININCDNGSIILYSTIIIIFISELYRKTENPINNIAITLMGILYTVLPYVAFIYLGFYTKDYNYELPLGFLILLWSSDSLAYAFGVKFGKTKLFERISPKKSWEGFWGAFFSNIIIAWGISEIFTSIPYPIWFIISIVIVSCGTLGDLIESMFKRASGVKDSGNILPGHGGVLDRFDGLLLAAPIVYIITQIINLLEI